MLAVCCFTITPRLIVHLKYFNIKLSLTFHPYLHMVAKKEIHKKTVSGFFFFSSSFVSFANYSNENTSNLTSKKMQQFVPLI